MRLPPKKCESCGDIAELFDYNQARTCAHCLGMDQKGLFRPFLFDRNTGRLKDNKKKYEEPRIRKDW